MLVSIDIKGNTREEMLESLEKEIQRITTAFGAVYSKVVLKSVTTLNVNSVTIAPEQPQLPGFEKTETKEESKPEVKAEVKAEPKTEKPKAQKPKAQKPKKVEDPKAAPVPKQEQDEEEPNPVVMNRAKRAEEAYDADNDKYPSETEETFEQVSLADVLKALRAHPDRTAVMALLKNTFKVKSIHELKPAQYANVIMAVEDL